MVKLSFLLLSLVFTTICNGQNQLFANYTTWNDVKSNVSKENKQILLYFGASWCAPCNQLKKGVFADSSTQAFLKTRFQSYEFDFDQEITVPFLKKYAISAVPWILILDNKGHLKASIPSIPQEIQAFKDALNKIAESDFTYKGISNELTMNYPEFYNKFYESRRQIMPDSATVLNYLKKQSDLFSEVNWNVLSLFNSSETYFDFVLSNKEKYKELYGELPVGLMLYHAYTMFFQKYAAAKDSVTFNRIIEKYIAKENDPNYKRSLSSFYMREIKFLAATCMDWNKFMLKADEYVRTYGESDNHFICSYAYDATSGNDSLTRFLLKLMQPVLTQMPYPQTYLMYGVLLLKIGNFTEAETYFGKALNSDLNPDSRSVLRKEIEEFKKEFRKV